MIIVRLWGGLGNQMFQYAFGYSIAKKLNMDLALDTTFYTDEFLKKNRHFSIQKPNLLKFPLKCSLEVCPSEIPMSICLMQKRTLSRIIRIPPRFIVSINKDFKYVKETRLRFLPYLNRINSTNIYFDGYWQSELYFREVKDDIKEQFRFESNNANEFANNQSLTKINSVSLHVRLGDYINSKPRVFNHYNHLISPSYYVNAVKHMYRIVDNPVFYVFSNDIKKAKDIFGNNRSFVYVNEDRKMSDLDEFSIMSMCKHHIISNSTFSWWAAWLSIDEGYTIAPDVFFGNSDILPSLWLRIKE